MRRLLPLVFSIALAAGAPVPASRKKRGRPALDLARAACGSDRDRSGTVRYDGPAAQCGRFDAITGTLTWFDDMGDAVTYN